jgi:formylglycine-generating enzyme required for sulfatase activity
MIPIPGGSYFMGSDDGLALEKPHQVTLWPYCIDQFEVRVDAYKACSDGGRCKRAGTTNEWEGIADREREDAPRQAGATASGFAARSEAFPAGHARSSHGGS